ncbi:hypothetical protein E2C01_002173 [Portunus trituberculatus]|uniref:Uncharacterized protein n=1 Tax=Portunus trituberculatus TaxID=210409 RepID=A0A5B7CKA4_PORTR|nr:hypothetical protein [Portunus trituberculatus]
MRKARKRHQRPHRDRGRPNNTSGSLRRLLPLFLLSLRLRLRLLFLLLLRLIISSKLKAMP